MSTTVIIILIVIIVALVAVGGVFYVRQKRSERLREEFGPEYEREVASAPSRPEAEKELQARQKRHRTLDVRPLERDERAGYRESWERVQNEFVDSPGDAVREADRLVIAIMRKRGYPTDDFDQRAADVSVDHPDVVEHYRVLLRAVSANPNLSLHEYRMLADHEEERLLHGFNDTRVEYPQDRCLHDLFLDQVEAHADKTAVVCGEERLTYRQLQERSRDLALYLQSKGVGPDSLVGVCMERSLEMVVALYGILQAGGAYLPLDPDYPDERLEHMVRDSQVAIVLTQ